MKKLLLLFCALLCLGGSRAWATVSFKADTPYLMIQRQSGKYVNMETLNTNARLKSAWSLVYFTSSDGGYIVSDGTNKISAEGYHAYVRSGASTVWTITEVDGVANGYKLYQDSSTDHEGYFGSDEYNESSPCFCDKAEGHASTTFIIIEANVYVKLQEMLTIPALYSTSDVNTVITAIKGTVLTTAEQETMLETLYSSAEGKKFYTVSNFGTTTRYLNVGASIATGNSTSLTTDAIMTVEYAGSGKYYLKGNNNYYICTPPNTNNTAPSTTSDIATAGQYYIGNNAKSTDNEVYFTTGFSADGNDHQALHWINNTNYVTGWSYSVPASQWTITYISDSEYSTLSSATSETLNYTLTDENGTTYTGTITGTLGVNPTFTGCTGYTLSNSAWNISTKTYTGTITFPFTVSSNSKNNYIYLSSFNSNKTICWYANGEDISMHYNHAPTNENIWQWQIIPDDCTTGAFSFKIRNANGKYIKIESDAQSSNHVVTSTYRTFDTGNVKLKDAGTSLTYNSYKWLTPSKSYCLSTYTSDKDIDQYLGLYGQGASHNGNNTHEIALDDFPSLISTLTTAKNTASAYAIGSGLGEYSEASSGAMATALSNANGIINGTAYGTPATITSYTTALGTAVSGLTLNMPSAPCFLRIQSTQGANAYLKGVDSGTLKFSTTKDKETIFLWAANGDLISYTKGLRCKDVKSAAAYNETPDYHTYAVETAVSGAIGKYSVTSLYKYGTSDLKHYLYSTGADNSDANRNTNNASFYNNNTFTLEAVSSLPITIGSAGFSTFYSPVNLTLDAGLTAYVGTITDRSTLTLTATDVIPANQGVILVGNAGDYTLTVGGTTDKTSSIKGSVAATTETLLGKQVLTLTSDAGSPVFRPFAGTNLTGFKGYLLEEDVPAGVKALTVEFLEDAIAALKAEKIQGTQSIYDLNGRRVERVQKGIYIVNGRKVVIK